VAAGKGKGGAGAVAQGGTLQERHFMGNINMFVLWHFAVYNIIHHASRVVAKKIM